MRLSDMKGDLSGAVSAAIISIPLSIGYGIIVYGPLGVKFVPFAALLEFTAVCWAVSAPPCWAGPKYRLRLPKHP